MKWNRDEISLMSFPLYPLPTDLDQILSKFEFSLLNLSISCQVWSFISYFEEKKSGNLAKDIVHRNVSKIILYNSLSIREDCLYMWLHLNSQMQISENFLGARAVQKAWQYKWMEPEIWAQCRKGKVSSQFSFGTLVTKEISKRKAHRCI